MLHNNFNGCDVSAVLASITMLTTLVNAEPPLTGKAKSIRLEKSSDFKLEGNMRRLIRETLYIDIRFLWFDNGAVARVGLYEKMEFYIQFLKRKPN